MTVQPKKTAKRKHSMSLVYPVLFTCFFLLTCTMIFAQGPVWQWGQKNVDGSYNIWFNSAKQNYTYNVANVSFMGSGNVGIGTRSPNYKLSVIADDNSSGITQVSQDRTKVMGFYTGTKGAILQTYTNTSLQFATNGSLVQMTLDTRGNLGIGTTDPIAPLSFASTSGDKISFWDNKDGSYFGLGIESGSLLQIHTDLSSSDIAFGYDHGRDFTETMRIKGNGNVGIGTADPGLYKLAVEGKIGAREIQVKTAPWADFVFDKNYRLRPLKEVEDSIKSNRHLPDVPSEEQVKKEGINLGSMAAILLQKIEELTLYAIEQDKRIEAIEKENASLKEKLKQQ